MQAKNPGRDAIFRCDLKCGLLAFGCSTLFAALAAVFGHEFVIKPGRLDNRPDSDLLAGLSHWDGYHYRNIVDMGYRYDPSAGSEVAFFPAYPLAGAALKALTGLRTDAALALVSHLALAVAFVAFHGYLRKRFDRRTAGFGVMALAVAPMGLFFHMTYSESLFILAFAVFLAAAADGRWWIAAAAAGLASGTRPVGIALAPALVVMMGRPTTSFAGIARWSALAATSVAGLVGYAAFLHLRFGDALAFARTQTYWRTHPDDAARKWASLLTLEPIHATFSPNSSRYWMHYDCHDNPIFSMTAGNPIWFSAAGLLVLAGLWRGWLNRGEAVAGLGLLLIPYVTRSYEFSGLSTGRFAVVVLPAFAVIARAMRDAPGWAPPALGGLSLTLYCFSVAMFVAGYPYF
jgi:hypothetical protein